MPLLKTEPVVRHLRCLLCGRTLPGRSFGRHLQRMHDGLDLMGYLVETKFKGTVPLCQCKCGQPAPYIADKGRFGQLILGHRSVAVDRKVKAWWKDPDTLEKRLQFGREVSRSLRRMYDAQSEQARERWRRRISVGVVRSIMNEGRRWHVTTYVSTKTGRSQLARSSWETRRYLELDGDPTVVDWRAECISIPYTLDGVQHRYVPDVLVFHADGSKVIEEIGPLDRRAKPASEPRVKTGQS